MKSTSENRIPSLGKPNGSLVCIKWGSANQCRVTNIAKARSCANTERELLAKKLSAVLISAEWKLVQQARPAVNVYRRQKGGQANFSGIAYL